MSSDRTISGPLGFWTYPLLNTLVELSKESKSNSEKIAGQTVEIAKVIRDEDGRLERVEVTRNE